MQSQIRTHSHEYLILIFYTASIILIVVPPPKSIVFTECKQRHHWTVIVCVV